MSAGESAVEPSPWRRVGSIVGIVLLWIAVAIAITWPLVGSLRTHHLMSWWGVPFDLYQGAWAMAWQVDVLSGRVAAPLPDANIFAPVADALYYGQTGWGALPLFAPVYLSTADPTLAINLTFLLGLALTAVGLHLVVWRWTGSTVAGFVAGVTFITNPWVLRWFVVTAPQLAAMMWMPWLALLASTRPFRLRHVLALAALVTLQSLTDVVYVTSALVAALGAQGAMRIARRESRADGSRLLAGVVLGLLALCPFLLPYARIVEANPDLASQSAWKTSLGGAWPFVSTHPIYLAPVSLFVVLVGIVCRVVARRGWSRPWATAVTWTAVGALLSVPPIMVLGGWMVPAPMTWLQELVPATATIRAVGRLGVVGLIGVALVIGLAFEEAHRLLARRMGDRLVTGVVTGVAIALYVSTLAEQTLFEKPLPLPRSLFPAPAVPDAFARFLRATRGPVIQVPPGRDGGIRPQTQATAMYRSIGRWYPLMNGYASYYPRGFERRMRIARHLPHPKALAELVRSTGLGTIWVDGEALSPRDRRRWQQVNAGQGLIPVARHDQHVLYVVVPRR